MINEEEIWQIIDSKKNTYINLSDKIFDTPEILYREFQSASEHTKILKNEGFNVTKNFCGMPTAVMGESVTKVTGPVIALIGEYDALPGLSQKSGNISYQPIQKSGNGHGCGHNLLGAASLLAASSIKDWIEKNNVNATIRYYGCPAEEGGAAKTYMSRDGLFDDVDTAICWHPATYNGVNIPESLANLRIDYTFNGKAAHAATSPHLGRSALDAVELMNVGVNYLREHIPEKAKVHYAYINSGGSAANVVQHIATIRQLIRASNLLELKDIEKRIDKISKGAALMTGTKVKKNVFSGVSNLLGNEILEKIMQNEFEKLGPVKFNKNDYEFAKKIRATFTKEEIKSSFKRIGLETPDDMILCDFISPLNCKSDGGIGSTDVGDISWVTPTVQARVATCAVGTTFHTWQTVTQGKMPAAHKGLVHAAKIMASTAIHLLKNPEKINQAKNLHKMKLKNSPYICPIPKEKTPPIIKN